MKPLWKHQQEAIDRAMELPHYALFHEMGVGKTRTLIEILRRRFASEGRLMSTLILAPPVVLENWKREWAEYSKVNPGKVVILYGSQVRRIEILEKNQDKCILITNYESLTMDTLFEALKKWKPEILVLDEAHRCKSTQAKRTKRAIQLADRVVYKYLLTGTPITNSAMDIFSQFRILDGGETFSKNFFIFRGNYFYDKNAGMPSHKHFPDWRIREGAMEDINKKIQAKAHRIKKQDCLDLPPLLRKEIYVELSESQQKLYKEMKRDFITFVQDKACVASLAITKALRLQQIVSGFVSLEDGSNHKIRQTPRAQALKELLEDLTPQHKVLVWAVFKENYEQIRQVCEELNLKFVEVHGEIPPKKRQGLVDEFTNNPEIRVFIGHPGAGGIGINLIAASYSIFFSRSFSLEQDLQAEARNYRGGSEVHEKITRIDLVAKETIDELILKRLSQKQEISEKVIDEMARELEAQ